MQSLFRRINVVINRAVLIVRYTQFFVDWVNAADPTPTDTITLADANDDSSAYLLEVEDERELDEWLALNGETLFEEVLNDWYTDPELWPQDRSLAMFRKWCSLELHTVVLDTGNSPLEDDEAD
jgi:hypothetical protein